MRRQNIFSYRARGDYAEQLERWLSVFDRDQLLLVRSEDLFRDPAVTLDRVERFVGLEPWLPDVVRQLERADPRGRPGQPTSAPTSGSPSSSCARATGTPTVAWPS